MPHILIVDVSTVEELTVNVTRKEIIIRVGDRVTYRECSFYYQVEAITVTQLPVDVDSDVTSIIVSQRSIEDSHVILCTSSDAKVFASLLANGIYSRLP